VTAPAQLAHDPTDPPIQTCDVCNHPGAAHDRIARRYCAATMANAISRTCICPPPGTYQDGYQMITVCDQFTPTSGSSGAGIWVPCFSSHVAIADRFP
jgi:hypothetical protein